MTMVTRSPTTRWAVVALGMLGWGAPALAQQQFEYAVKFLCGQSDGKIVSVAPGTYGTAINIHNPDERALDFRYKVVVAPPGGIL